MSTPKHQMIWRARGRNNKQHAVKTQDVHNWTAFCGITGGSYFNTGSSEDWFHCRKCEEAISKTKP